MEKTRSARKLPSALGNRMPAEWEPHESTWLAWPHLRGDWPGKFEPIPWVYAEIVRNLARHERVDLIVKNERAENGARAVLERADALSDNVCFHRWRTDRVWTRDSGCIFLAQNTEPQGLKPPTNDDASGTAEEAAERIAVRCPAPKGASDFEELTVSLKRYPDTNRHFFAAREGVFVTLHLWHAGKRALIRTALAARAAKLVYFQLQLGCVLTPLKVNCFTIVPSASIVHIWSLPERWD